MAFKVSTAERANVTRVSTLEVPEDFMKEMEAQYAVVSDDPTKEIVLGGDTAKETALYVQWAKFWGLNREGLKLTVVKQPAKADATEARLTLKAYDPTAAKRGRKPKAAKA